jgi:hypothetical protein
VLDLTELSEARRRDLRARRFDVLITVAALGFGDIPPSAFAEAFNLVSDGGWVAFNIKQQFLDDGESTGFSRLVDRRLGDGIVEKRAETVYRHRLSANGESLDYVAIVGVKRDVVTDALLSEVDPPS